ncbi:hypothetical protein MTO96_013120 [Rhipicephalus appendiculatus]
MSSSFASALTLPTLRERPGVGETYAAILLHQRFQRRCGEQEGSAQRPAHAAGPRRRKRKSQADYDRLRPMYRSRRHLLQHRFPRLRRERVGVGEAIAAPRPLRRGRNPFGEQVRPAQADARPTKTKRKRKEDDERLRSDCRRRPFLLQHRVARLPGEHPGVGEATAGILLLRRAQHLCGEQRGPAQRPVDATESTKAKQKEIGLRQVAATVKEVPLRRPKRATGPFPCGAGDCISEEGRPMSELKADGSPGAL